MAVETISQQVLDVVVLLGADASDTATSGRYNLPEATIRRPKKKSDKLQLTRQTHKSCLSRFDSAAYNLLQFLLAVSLSMGAHGGAFIFDYCNSLLAGLRYRNRRRSHFREFRINKQTEFSSPDGNFYDEQNAPIIFGWGSAPDPPLAISRCPQRPHSRTGRWTPHSRGLWVPMTPFFLRTASRSEPSPRYTLTL